MKRGNLKKDTSGKDKYEKGQLCKGNKWKKTVLKWKHKKKDNSEQEAFDTKQF